MKINNADKKKNPAKDGNTWTNIDTASSVDSTAQDITEKNEKIKTCNSRKHNTERKKQKRARAQAQVCAHATTLHDSSHHLELLFWKDLDSPYRSRSCPPHAWPRSRPPPSPKPGEASEKTNRTGPDRTTVQRERTNRNWLIFAHESDSLEIQLWPQRIDVPRVK